MSPPTSDQVSPQTDNLFKNAPQQRVPVTNTLFVEALNTFSKEQIGPNYYPETTLDIQYEFVSGKLQIPTGNADTSDSEIVDLHNGYWVKVVEFDFEKRNSWPVCPGPDTGNPNETLIYQRITPKKPLQGPGGLKIYRVSGRYVYSLKGPISQTGPFSVATDPADTLKAGDYDFGGSLQFDNNMLKSATGSKPIAPVQVGQQFAIQK